jgi:hypothetical protein
MDHKIITSENLLSELEALLKKFQAANLPSAFIGFDGFVDTILQAVQHRTHEIPTFFGTISEFTEHLNQMNGKSGQVEVVKKQIKMGGNAPILSCALGKLGVRNTVVGSMGFPQINPLFQNTNPIVNQITIASPGQSEALEFENGKIIFSDLSSFQFYNWQHIKKTVATSKLQNIAKASKLFALVDWANLTCSTNLWKGFLDDIIKPLGKRDQYFLFDLCDPSKKSYEQIEEVLDLISHYTTYGKVTLGLNENEANRIWLALNGYDPTRAHGKVEIPALDTVGYFIYRLMDIDTLLIHPIDRTLAFKNQKNQKKPSLIELYGRRIQHPRVLAGGGDNLNAGYIVGLLAGFEIHHCLLLAMAVSGSYVQLGSSPTLNDLMDYINYWKEWLVEKQTAEKLTAEKQTTEIELVKEKKIKNIKVVAKEVVSG